MHEPRELLQLGTGLFGARLASVADSQWTAPTPCAEWNVLDLVNHVVMGNRMAISLLDGSAPAPQEPTTSEDAVRAFERTTVRQDRAFRSSPGEQAVAHPAGVIPASDFAVFRCADVAVHAWDLARAIGADDDLGPVLVAQALQPYVEWVDSLDTEGMYAPAKHVDTDAPHQNRLLARIGRTP